MSGVQPTRLAVLGSPIVHSKSPALHAAAYAVLGIDWQYDAIEVTGETLADFVESRDDNWRGLSLTMPLKRDVLELLDRRDPLVDQTGSANTVLFRGTGAKRYLHGFNTDVDGIVQAFTRHGHTNLSVVQILGGGATAASALAAVGRLGASRVQLSVRTPAKAEGLIAVGATYGVDVVVGSLADAATALKRPDAVISTLPNGVELDVPFSEQTRRNAVLFDVAYHPWPSTLATKWQAVDGAVIGGLEMLVLQALVQIRIFMHNSPERVLERENEVLAAMRAAVGL